MKVCRSPHGPGRVEQRMLEAVLKTVREYQMIKPGDSVLVGVSGGPDSMALLHVLVSLTPVFSLRLGVAHLNHCLRPLAADDDAGFVARAATALGLPFFVEKKDVAGYRRDHRLSPEEAARRVRYRFFEKTARLNGYIKVAVGHHSDDNAEQVLINLLRGTGPSGLSGIPPVRLLSEGKEPQGPPALPLAIFRPLIRSTRKDILDYLSERDIAYVSDDSNTDPQYLRNRLRHRLIPHLEETYNPKIVAALNRLSAILRSDEDWADGMARDLFASLARSTASGKGVALGVGKLRQLHPAVCRRIVRQALSQVKGNLRRISFDHVTAVQTLLGEGKTGARLDLPAGIRVMKENGALLFFEQTATPEAPAFCYYLPKPHQSSQSIQIAETGDRLRFDRSGLPEMSEIRRAGQRVAFFDMDKLEFPLTVRNFRPGDRFTPLGMKGHKKVKNYFIDSGVPKSLRRRCPLLVSGGEVVWIAGHRMGASAQVNPATRQTLRAELFLA